MTKKMQKNKFPLLILMVTSLFTLSCLVVDSKKISITNLHLLETNKHFESSWNLSDMNVGSNWERSNIVGASGKIIIGGRLEGEVSSNSIIAVDSLSGDVIWTNHFVKSGYQMIVQGEKLYRGTFGTVTVQCYDVHSGKLQWSSLLPQSRNVVEIYSVGNRVFVYTANSKFFVLNEDGEILNNYRETFKTFLQIDNILYMEDNLAIKAIDTLSEETVWLTQIEKRYRLAPVFDDNTIFLSTWSNPADIFSIERYTGEINWKVSQDVLSNLYVSGEKIYFLSYLNFVQNKGRLL